MTRLIKSYAELLDYSTYEDRLKYLSLEGIMFESTFGSQRYLNQILYKTTEWLRARDRVIVRDDGCDLGVPEYRIDCDNFNHTQKILVHHINPITIDDIKNRNPIIFDTDNLITTTIGTHKIIHYGETKTQIGCSIVGRQHGDTCPWLL